MERLKVGVIGAGYLGEIHIQKLMSIDRVELKGFLDTDAGRRACVANRYGIRAFEDLQEFLGEVDACVIAAPTPLHYDLTLRAFEAGRHVLLEKPMCQEVQEAEELVRVASKKGLVLQIGHVERFNPAVAMLLRKARPPFYFQARRETPPLKRALLTDVVMDLMIHDLDILLALNPSRITGVDATGLSRLGRHLDLAGAWVSFEDGSRAHVMGFRLSDSPLRQIRVVGVGYSFNVDCSHRCFSEVDVKVQSCDLDSSKCEFRDSDPLLEEDRAFVEAVLDHNSPVVSGEDGLKVLRLAHEIRSRIRPLNPP